MPAIDGKRRSGFLIPRIEQHQHDVDEVAIASAAAL